MHALRRFIQSELDSRGWQARDLVKASGLSKQLVHILLNDDRDILPQLPRTKTLEALAQAFSVSTAHVTMVAVEALGVEGVNAPLVVHSIREADDEVLLQELLRRAIDRTDDQVAAPARRRPSREVTPLRRRSITTIQAELRAAEETLAEWDALNVANEGEESKRPALQADVDALKAELAASRRVTSGTDSVAEL